MSSIYKLMHQKDCVGSTKCNIVWTYPITDTYVDIVVGANLL